MGRSDEVTRVLRGELGLGMDRRDECTVAMEGPMPAAANARGLELSDLDQMLRQRAEEGYWRGRADGDQEASERLRRQHDVELGQYVGAALGMVESEVLSRVTLAAIQASQGRGTRKEIVDAVVVTVKREAAALHDVAHRARTGELFS